MIKKLVCIRGAVCSENTASDITKNVESLCNQIFTKNKIKSKNLISVSFSITKDITKLNPASALRKCNCVIDVSKTALFCTQEAEIENMLPNVIRVMVYAYKIGSKKSNVYLNGAEKLRPDYSEN